MRFLPAKAAMARTVLSSSMPMSVSEASFDSISRRRRAAMTETTMSDISGTCPISASIASRSATRNVQSRTARMASIARPPVRNPISPANCPGPSVAPSP